MEKQKKRLPVTRQLCVLVFFLSAALMFPPIPASAANKMEADQLVEKARLTFENFMCADSMGAFRNLVQKAEGVLIVPSLLKGAFVIGASGGSGVLLVRDKATGGWSQPAFYTIGGASFGLQIGGQSSEVILLAMTERGVRSFLGSSFKLGGDVGAAAGPVGIGASAATANLSADILSFSRSKGLYGGISLDGAVVAVRGSLNSAYYGKEVSPVDILISHSVKNPESVKLAQEVGEAARGSKRASQCSEENKTGRG
jgi:lipid-binding SYLF domain-containing protein